MAWQWKIPENLDEIRYHPHTGRRLGRLGRLWWYWRLGGRLKDIR